MFRYFGFGSNLNSTSLSAKGVEPLVSRRAVLNGWRLCFNVQHFFRHEGGVGNIERSDANDQVLGVLYDCPDDALQALDAMEAYGYGYDRISIEVDVEGETIEALTYVGMPDFIDNNCLPSQRYLNIVIDGAKQAGLDNNYIKKLQTQPVHQVDNYPIFKPPEGKYLHLNQASLVQNSMYTALNGFVFDMSDARPQHDYLKSFFGGRDMTLFHLKRLDSSDGKETMDHICNGCLNKAQRLYLNAYLNEYAKEYRYVGQIDYKI